MTKQPQFDFTAKARRDDPVTSHMAAGKMNEKEKLSEQRFWVLRCLKSKQPCTAKEIDCFWEGKGPAHRRMKELENMGLVQRIDKDENGKQLPEMICSLTEKGERFLGDNEKD